MTEARGRVVIARVTCCNRTMDVRGVGTGLTGTEFATALRALAGPNGQGPVDPVGIARSDDDTIRGAGRVVGDGACQIHRTGAVRSFSLSTILRLAYSQRFKHLSANQKVLNSKTVLGAKLFQFESLCLRVNCLAVEMFAKWPIVAKAGSLTHSYNAS